MAKVKVSVELTPDSRGVWIAVGGRPATLHELELPDDYPAVPGNVHDIIRAEIINLTGKEPTDEEVAAELIRRAVISGAFGEDAPQNG